MRCLAVFLALSIGSALQAGQGLIIMQTHENLNGGSTSEQTLRVEPNRVSADMADSDRRMTFAYLADERLMRLIDHSRQEYREMTEQQLEAMAAKMQGAMSLMQQMIQERMKNMTPEQRAAMEKMMGGQMQGLAAAGAAPEPLKFRRGQGSATIAGYECDWYEGYRGDELQSKVCAVDWADVDVKPEDFAVFAKMADFIGKLAPNQANRIAFGAPDWKDRDLFPGVPAEMTTYANGQPQTKTTLQSVERERIPDSAYTAPDSYTKRQGFGADR